MGLFTCLPHVLTLCGYVVFCTNSEKVVRPLRFVYLLRPFVSGCLLLLSVRYGFVYMFTQCVNLMWLFCVFVPIAKK